MINYPYLTNTSGSEDHANNERKNFRMEQCLPPAEDHQDMWLNSLLTCFLSLEELNYEKVESRDLSY